MYTIDVVAKIIFIFPPGQRERGRMEQTVTAWLSSMHTMYVGALYSTSHDCHVIYVLSQTWKEQRPFFRSGHGSSEERWCERNMISYRAMREVDEVARELRMRLATRGIRPPKRTTLR